MSQFLAFGDPLRSITTSGLGQLLMMFLGTGQQQQAQQNASEANLEAETELRSLFNQQDQRFLRHGREQGDFLNNLFNGLQQTNASNTNLNVAGRQGLENNILGRLGQVNNQVAGTLRDRYRSALADLEGMGAQSYRDIDERYQQNQANAQQDLVSRGLGNSSLQASVSMASERERGREQALLGEQLRRERIGITSDLLGDIAAQQDVGGTRLADAAERLGGNTLGAMEFGRNTMFGLQSGLGDALYGNMVNTNNNVSQNAYNRINFLNSITNQYPDSTALNNAYQGLGVGMAGHPQAPGTNWGQVGGGLLTGLGAVLAPFTGGLSLALSGVGAGMSAASSGGGGWQPGTPAPGTTAMMRTRWY